MKNKKDIRKVLKNSLNLKFSIKPKAPTEEQIQKSLFVDSITTLLEIQERTEFMATEFGFDTYAYEDKYYRVIENLFKLHYNPEQLSLIQLYLYELKPDKTWDGMLELEQPGKEAVLRDFSTPKAVWEVINLFTY